MLKTGDAALLMHSQRRVLCVRLGQLTIAIHINMHLTTHSLKLIPSTRHLMVIFNGGTRRRAHELLTLRTSCSASYTYVGNAGVRHSTSTLNNLSSTLSSSTLPPSPN